MKLKKESEITSFWKESVPVVSVCCIAYNQEDFICDAIDSFLMQITDFRFEIIVHDDASTDDTLKKILKYEKEYPNIVNVISQSENQYSKGVNIPFMNVAKKAKGEYFALCEGDDYWLSPHKLQLQVNLMREYNECAISFHDALKLSSGGLSFSSVRLGKSFFRREIKKTVYRLQEVILGGGGFMATASIMLKREVVELIPKWYLDAPVGDYYLQILGSINGGALYFSREFSVYRFKHAGSWSYLEDRVDVLELKKRVQMHLNCLGCLNDLVKEDAKLALLKAKAKEVLRASSVSLMSKENEAYIDFIMHSWAIFPRVNVKQCLLYYFRSSPFFVRCAIKVYRFVF